VLLVEDDSDIAGLLSLVLKRVGLTVSIARTIAQAKAALEGPEEWDVILADKNLPDGSGMTLLEYFRGSGKYAELVVMTGFPSVESAVQAVRLGVYDYLEKPFRDLGQVATTVLRACEHRHLRMERDDALKRALLAERRASLVQVAAGIAHEVKNPLQGISFACANAKDSLRNAEVGDVLEQIAVIEAEARRLRDLVEGVLDLARPEQRPPQRVEIRKLIRDIELLHNRAFVQGGVRLETDIFEGRDLFVDERDVSRALDNLVRNALDVSPKGGLVRISSGDHEKGKKDSLLFLEVSDEGPGFSEEAKTALFRPFFTTKANGFGLGLCQVAAAADRAGGMVVVKDNAPTGARVRLCLPAWKKGS